MSKADRRKWKQRYRPCQRCGRRCSLPALSADGICPACADPALYAECRKISAEEEGWRMDPMTPGNKVSARNRRVIARMAAQIRTYNRRMPGEPLLPTVAEAALSDGYTPTARNHKRGGPNGRDG